MDMRKLFTTLTLCLAVLCSADESYYARGVCDATPSGEPLYWTLDTVEIGGMIGLQLAFWRNGYGQTERTPGSIYSIPDYCAPGDMSCGTAPWYEYAHMVMSIDLQCVDQIGDNAFLDMTGLRFVALPEVQRLGNEVFLGCLNLHTIQILSDNVVPTITTTSLLLDSTTGEQINTVILPGPNSIGAYQYDANWGIAGRRFIPATDESTDAKTILTPFEDGSMALSVSYTPLTPDDPTDLLVIRDIDTADVQNPWHELRGMIRDLTIGDRVAYIGRNAFSSLTNLQTIRFSHAVHPLDSIHIDAFGEGITPWMFAFGEGNDGAAVPPQVVGVTAENATHFDHFKTNTVLFVPDSSVWDGTGMRRTVELYKEDPFWGASFARVNDRTVDTTAMTENSIVMRWLPLEKAEAYRLTITKIDCTERCDTSIVLPATGVQGLINWDLIPTDIPQYLAAPRLPKGDDGDGGLTLTISIKSESGTTHTTDAELTVTGLEPGTDYLYTREVVRDGRIDESLTKTGVFATPQSMQDITILPGEKGIVRIYDLMGREWGAALHLLPAGAYIIDNGTHRTTVYLTR